MSAHPLIDLANDATVKQPATFREVAETLTAERIAEAYAAERETATAEATAELEHFVDQDGTIADPDKVSDQEMAVAIFNQCKLDGVPLKLANGIEVDPLGYRVPLTTLPPKKIKAKMRVISAADLIGIEAEEQRLAVCRLELMPLKSTKGDSPLRGLLEGLAVCAAVEGWRSTITSQMTAKFDRTPSDAPPVLIVLANSRYWEIWRKRSLKSAGPWMSAIGKLGELIEDTVGVTPAFASVRLYGDPPWRVRQDKPLLDAEPRLTGGLEPAAGELRSKSKARAVKVDEVVQPDYARPVRTYSVRELYDPGDRVAHPTLGEGVVQKALGPNKVEVRFGEEPKVLVQGRA